jgi:hypothetical protein
MLRTATRLKLWASRIGWMVVIWTGSVAGLAVAASVLRFIMKAAGMKS